MKQMYYNEFVNKIALKFGSLFAFAFYSALFHFFCFEWFIIIVKLIEIELNYYFLFKFDSIITQFFSRRYISNVMGYNTCGVGY